MSTIRVLLVLLQKLIFIVSCDVCYLSFILIDSLDLTFLSIVVSV